MLYTAESVTSGHPDKICDQISDAILDEYLRQDPASRVAVETFGSHGLLVIGGEVTSSGQVDAGKIAAKVYKDIGHEDNLEIQANIVQQSPDIAQGVDAGGAGDQGIMYGYATDETKECLPLPVVLAHQLTRGLEELRRNNPEFNWLRPDGKAQVTVKYNSKGRPVSVERIVLAKPHDPKIKKNQVVRNLYQKLVVPLLHEYKLPKVAAKKVIFNGTDNWEIGGPASDPGVTGRKIVVDTYGGMGRIGGGCFSGKDPTKVDRSAAYAARYIAKNIVAAGLADRCEVQVAYAIGHRDPVAKAIEVFGTNNKPMKTIENFAWKLIDLSVKGIVETLDLRQPIYRNTAMYGHFGNPAFTWEKLV